MVKPKKVPKEYQEVIDELVGNQGWRRSDTGGGYPKLWPSDGVSRPISVPRTPSDHRSFKNWISQIRNAGGIWPPNRKKG